LKKFKRIKKRLTDKKYQIIKKLKSNSFKVRLGSMVNVVQNIIVIIIAAGMIISLLLPCFALKPKRLGLLMIF